MFLRDFVFVSFLCVSISHAHMNFDIFSNSKPANTNTNAAPKSGNLLDVSVNVDPILNLLGQNKNRPEVVTSTTTEVPSTTSLKPTSISDRYTFTPAVAKCGQKVVQHTELITNGLSTKPGDWPWHAALYRLKNTGSQQQYICGGSLISPTRVLTAAHCVHENNAVILAERMFVTLGKYNLAGGDMDSQERSVYDILVHPAFDRSTLAHDIAILKLSSRVAYSDYVQPICLWDESNSGKTAIVNTIGTVVGWGFTEQDTLANQLTSATMPVTDDLSCIKSNPVFYSKFITDGTFCAGYRNGTSVCNGDSGGGMYFKQGGADGQESWAVRGIVSLSASRKDKNLCDPTEYTIFTDAAHYRDFINHHL